jgi:cation diffusion facilitator CzcD-associated flavoprotein CzcO
VTRWASQAFVETTFVLAGQFAGNFPSLRLKGEGAGRKHLLAVVDPDVREKLTPKYSLGCKRPSFSNEYLPTFNRDNVQLETTAIEAIRPTGIRTADGVEHPLDVLVCATGFKAFETDNLPPFEVRGSAGVSLGEWWDTNRFQAYEGVSVPGFPNWFSILGPYGFNGQSYFGLIETQMRHITRCLGHARQSAATRVEIRPEANRRYFESVLARRHNQIFFQGSCETANSYYFDKHGDAPFRPSLTLEAAWRSARYDLDDYAFAG